ncbi:hypothetical protein CPB83DRAFT_907075 [Crepidotus variabilis]|uniref:Uncharacterized protein n=1 Tax=Crepidotus variabilis TaxID=179855 RepID=A0A9P6EFV4_9AGAR|nr:hypothetical protein CPB83DRAFT_907075 [Crepidotus variabilis]
MRRAQSTRHYARPSLALATDDMGMLREGDESSEDALRRQLIEREREIDKLKLTVQTLQDQLAQRPPIEAVQELQQEFKNLELILQGTQRENEKCMADAERQKMREKMLERELTRLAGDNWQMNLEITQTPTSANPLRSGTNLHQRSNTLSRAVHSSSPVSLRGSSHSRQSSFSKQVVVDQNQYEEDEVAQALEGNDEKRQKEEYRAAQRAHLEQLRMLILGMEQRLEVREEKLVKVVEKAEAEGKRYEAAAASVGA